MSDNILLIGMPGCGKSTIGRALSMRLGYSFIDADAEFEEFVGISPADYIECFGVPKFRKEESEVLAGFLKCTKTVISLGGGVVEIPSNKDIIRAAGLTVYIRRSLDRLARAGRPVTAAKGVEKLYEERREAYETWADICIENDADIDTAVDRLLEKLDKSR